MTQARPGATSGPVRQDEPTEMPTDTSQKEVLRPRHWTTVEYHALSDAGFFDDERVELPDGEIWTLPSQKKTPIFYSIDAAGDILLATFGEGFIVRCHGPIILEDGTEPEPVSPTTG